MRSFTIFLRSSLLTLAQKRLLIVQEVHKTITVLVYEQNYPSLVLVCSGVLTVLFFFAVAIFCARGT